MSREDKGIRQTVKKMTSSQIFIPLLALVLLAVFNLIADPGFYKITLGYNNEGYPILSGYLVTILNYGSEIAILAIGMTLVTAASGGQDISAGAVCYRKCYFTCPLRNEFQTRHITGTNYSGIFGMLCGYDAVWGI